MSVASVVEELEELDTYPDDLFVYAELHMYADVVWIKITRGDTKYKRVYKAIEKMCKKRALDFEGLFGDKFSELHIQ